MVNDFIGVYENAVPHNVCDALIEHFEKLNALGLSRKRSNTSVKDVNVGLFHPETIDFITADSLGARLLPVVWGCYDQYVGDIEILNRPLKMHIKNVKVQKTDLSCGYHAWHMENEAVENRQRVLAWSVYLNDVHEGGETEFLYQRRRVEAAKGTLVMWPAGFTHAHRGNPPLSGVKYIATSWIEHVA
jgi:hypothetical protein